MIQEHDVATVRGAALRVGTKIAPPKDKNGRRSGNAVLVQGIVPCTQRDKIHVNPRQDGRGGQCYDLCAWVDVVRA